MRSVALALACTIFPTFASAARVASDEVPLPPGASLRGTIETDTIRELPELKGARLNRMRDNSISGVHVLDQSFDAELSYRDAVRFYDRALAGAFLIEREEAETATGWLVRLDDGVVASISLRNTHPTTIEIQRIVP